MKRLLITLFASCLVGLSTTFTASAAYDFTVDIADPANGVSGGDWSQNLGKVGGAADGYANGRMTGNANIPTGTTGGVVGNSTVESTQIWNGPNMWRAWSKQASNGGNVGISAAGQGGFRLYISGNAANANFYNAFTWEMDGGTASLTETNGVVSATVRLNNYTAAKIAQLDLRYIAKEDGVYYISSPIDLRSSLTDGQQDLTNTLNVVTETTWYLYDPYKNPNGATGLAFTPQTSGSDKGLITHLISDTSTNMTWNNVTQLGFSLQSQYGATGGSGSVNVGVNKFEAIVTEDAPPAASYTPTNSITWSSDNVVSNGYNAYGGVVWDPTNEIASYEAASVPFYGANWGIYRNGGTGSNSDFGVQVKNSGGARLRMTNPGGGTNATVNSQWNLYLMPMAGHTQNDGLINATLWSNQGGGVTEAGAAVAGGRAVIGTSDGNFYISDFYDHEPTAHTTQYKSSTISGNVLGMTWYNYNLNTNWATSITNIGSTVVVPDLTGGIDFAGVRLEVVGRVSSTDTYVIGMREYAFSGATFDEGDNDVLAIDWDYNMNNNDNAVGSKAIQFEYANVALDLSTANPVSTIITDGIVTPTYGLPSTNAFYSGNGASGNIYIGLDLDPNDPSLITGSAAGVTNAASFSYGNPGLKLQWNGPWTNNVHTITDDPQYSDAGRYAAGDVATGVAIWKKEDFLNGLDTGDIYMTTTNDVLRANLQFSPDGDKGGDAILSEANFRWIIQDDGVLYVSGIASTQTESGIVNLSDGARDQTWYVLDTTGGNLSDIASTPSTPGLLNIEAIGIWMQATVTGNDGLRKYPNFLITSFEAGVHKDPVTPTSRFNEWLASKSMGNVGSVNMAADLDGDGMDTLMEYAFGGNPNAADAASRGPKLLTDDTGSVFIYVHEQRTDNPGLTYKIELDGNNSLAFGGDDWTASGISPAGESASHNGFKSVTNATPINADTKFIKVTIEFTE